MKILASFTIPVICILLILTSCGAPALTPTPEPLPAPAPTPALTPTPEPLPAPIPIASSNISKYEDSHFGFGHVVNAYADAASLGVHWERPHPGPVVWGYIEKEEDNYRWEIVDRYVTRAQEYGFNLILTIWPFADWDHITCYGTECQGAGFERELPLNRCKPCNLLAYKQFVRNYLLSTTWDRDSQPPKLPEAIAKKTSERYIAAYENLTGEKFKP